MLTQFVNTDNISSATLVGSDRSGIEIFPNPISDHFQIRGLQLNDTIKIIDGSGIVYTVVVAQSGEEIIDTRKLSSGIYFESVQQNGSGPDSVHKIIKAN